ncbi:cellobiose phosphorylase [Mordavella massiliensis]|uniref:Cellobiose phosphorylase n=1 Tax=Mordavella massiliensis TaxID=1871024 RepID=A0A939BHZ4_9CLOT|nr:cellobiose phosphorylase [Mordavella massiliensis]MBM6949361.1 cellobiose phosphorylase [Mordavella massiliensis]
MKHTQFTDNNGSFSVEHPENTSYLYFPLASEKGLKSCVTPILGGDSKLDQETFLLEPVSSENLHSNRATRNFWLKSDDGRITSITGASDEQESRKFTPDQEKCILHAGFMWHCLERTSSAPALKLRIVSFVPWNNNVEIMHIAIQNQSEKVQNLTPYAAIPIYGRSADNLRDHRNVTSMLHRIETEANGITVCPTMSFDERGHRKNHTVYYVYGFSSLGQKPERFYPTVEEFIGEGGSYTHPRAVYESFNGVPCGTSVAGKEAIGAFAFPEISLDPGQGIQYAILLGADTDRDEIRKIYEEYSSVEKIQAALDETIRYWAEKVNVTFHTGNPDQDMFMKWVCFQPYLRRIYGCSFLPHHDYGRGGRGWRDLWQDCLSLLLMDPQNVGKMIENNYGGVRIDGTNATIIGNGEGNFIADRNNITRVWMDHALWPLITTQLYIDQTGDIDILNRKVPYFKDAQTERGRLRDQLWSSEQGNKQMTQADVIYKGSILEHLLIQQLSAFYEIGEHNIYRLRDADWNDALDMAPDRGESVAFTCAYAGNLRNLARMIRLLEAYSGQSETELLYEIQILLGHDRALYDNISRKSEILHKYVKSCRHTISGQRFLISYASLASDLELKAEWLTEHIRNQEWICGQENEGWFNSYYDNHGQAVERYSKKPGDVRMMLTGQVFAIMGQVASPQQIRQIVTSADRYLYRKDIGGYRLNTDFQELKFDMGRMFGFAYGEKENGAVFSHMTVMFAYALYQRGFAREGWKALRTLADTALDFDTSHIYPGIPEYFRSDGRGMYHYLTGAASWFMLTMITQVFGVRGEAGNLLMEPKLTSEQFDETGTASVQLTFAGKEFTVTYINSEHKEYGNYITGSATCNQEYLKIDSPNYTMLSRETIIALPSRNNHIVIHLV